MKKGDFWLKITYNLTAGERKNCVSEWNGEQNGLFRSNRRYKFCQLFENFTEVGNCECRKSRETEWLGGYNNDTIERLSKSRLDLERGYRDCGVAILIESNDRIAINSPIAYYGLSVAAEDH